MQYRITAFLAGLVLSVCPVLAVVPAGTGGLTEADFRTSPGVAVNGINHDGVAEMIMRTTDGNFRGSAALLWTGRHLLTAAHNVTDNAGDINIRDNTNSTATFELSTGDVTYTYRDNDVTVHPLWSGSVVGGRDIALIDLGEIVDINIPRYNIFTSTDFTSDVDGKAFTMFGYGRTGTGSTGDNITSGTKRWGMNNYQLNFTSGRIGYDFDNGLTAQDYIGGVFSKPDLGLGDFESSSAPGDSGGPTFLSDASAPGGYSIAGIVSYGSRSSTYDINGSIDASFGEYSVDTEVAEFADWIFGEIGAQPIPEPSTFVLLAGAVLLIGSRPRHDLNA